MSKKQVLDENLLSPLEKQARKVMSFVQYNKPKKPIEWSFVLFGLVLYYLFATVNYNREISPIYLIVGGVVTIIVLLHWFSYINRTKTWKVLKEELSEESKNLVTKGKLLTETELRNLLTKKVNEVNMKNKG
ncbi:MAG: hypothetical protein K0R71_2089 [Bacillales bacterium]|jgi:hypothetical protein|nr:hypothetical protein [Bacillales bacterium]